MEKLYHAKLHGADTGSVARAMQNPIELDNKAFDIPDGDSKMLDYLDYSSTMTKGALAACGSIKLHPKSEYKYDRDYGAYSPYEREKTIKSEDDDGYINSWDNIFLKAENNQNGENFFMQCVG